MLPPLPGGRVDAAIEIVTAGIDRAGRGDADRAGGRARARPAADRLGLRQRIGAGAVIGDVLRGGTGGCPDRATQRRAYQHRPTRRAAANFVRHVVTPVCRPMLPGAMPRLLGDKAGHHVRSVPIVEQIG